MSKGKARKALISKAKEKRREAQIVVDVQRKGLEVLGVSKEWKSAVMKCKGTALTRSVKQRKCPDLRRYAREWPRICEELVYRVSLILGD